MKLGLVSIVIPFYNHKNYVQKAYEGILKQTYKQWELIFVDNNSSDGSKLIADKIALADNRVKVFTEKRQGIAQARNGGLAIASGEYVSFLDIDDEFYPDKLEVLTSLMHTYPTAAFAYGLTNRIYLPEDRSKIQDAGIVKEGLNKPGSLAGNWIKSLYHLPQTGASIAKTTIAQQIGGFDESLALGNDDVGYHLKIAFNYPIAFVNKKMVKYFRHDTSAGAILNNQVSVNMRYFEAYQKAALPLSIIYEQESGDSLPLMLSRRNVYSNLVKIIYQSSRRQVAKNQLKDQYKISLPWMYMLLLNLTGVLSYRKISFLTKVLYKVLFYNKSFK